MKEKNVEENQIIEVWFSLPMVGFSSTEIVITYHHYSMIWYGLAIEKFRKRRKRKRSSMLRIIFDF